MGDPGSQKLNSNRVSQQMRLPGGGKVNKTRVGVEFVVLVITDLVVVDGWLVGWLQ